MDGCILRLNGLGSPLGIETHNIVMRSVEKALG